MSGEKTLLPADLVRHRVQRAVAVEPGSLACGTTRDEALLHALFEVVEREVPYREG